MTMKKRVNTPMSTPKILKETLALADGGRVVCQVEAPDGSRMQGIIEDSFFEDFMGEDKPVLSAQRKARIVMDNIEYFEGELARQWAKGQTGEVVIR
jgi:hypothetical protein